MKSLRHRLPALKSLMVFEAAGRTLNFTRAAEELHVSQAAISKQVKYLEEYLGFPLFERHGRRVILSSRGEQLHEKVSASFYYLADAVDEQRALVTTTSITVSANTAVSHYWLSHAINGFHRAYDNRALNIRVITSDNTQDLFSDEVNIAIAYEPGARAGWKMKTLFAEELFPVASPEYLKAFPVVGDNPAEFLNRRLLDFDRIEPNWINWKVWFEALSVDTQGLSISSRFNNYIMLIDAAKRGQGVTLGTRHLIDSKLKDGQLCRVSDFSVLSGRRYWLVLNEAKPITEDCQLLFDWLEHYEASNRHRYL
ncbi:LysR substrate-binding domain-containing protein [Amphritea sp. 1_MG-2023]|uniref:LysR substrate-binding domain-containing protein n=1 Tax=Amphritea sp. 1_MG-2023 TaxID=3062670 RepID=UPI0026E31AA9|nr:LysR substrate-binding domain-containing protein [Amphritea sp. 1_MG-2023]MDO6565288.1 LysR substrate-binding domain-containing protein [Amphritea sp. 1_MG-2023]